MDVSNTLNSVTPCIFSSYYFANEKQYIEWEHCASCLFLFICFHVHFSKLNQRTSLYDHYSILGDPNIKVFNFLQSVMAMGRINEIARWAQR
jgi:hypothetical protein